MDAVHTNLKKIVLLFATALLLAAPLCAQTTLNAGATTVNLGSASCNNFQFVTLSSSAGPIVFQVSVQYQAGDQHGTWLYASDGTHFTSAGTSFAATVDSSTTPVTTVSLKIGLGTQFTSADTATVLLHSLTAGVADVPITVNYNPVNSSCTGGTGSIGNGIINITPGSLALTANQFSSQTQPLNLQNLTGSAVTFNASIPNTAGWLSSDVSGPTTIPANSQVTVNVTGTAGNLGTGTLNSEIDFIVGGSSTIVLPVSFTIGSGSGTGPGTLTLNGSTSTTVTYNYIGAGPAATGLPNAVCVDIEDSNATVTTYSVSFATSAGGSWLRVNNQDSSPQLNQPIGQHCLQLQGNSLVSALAPGVYTANVLATASDNSTASVAVTLYVTTGSPTGVTVQPGLIYNFQGVAAGSTTSQQQQFNITAGSGVTLGTATPTTSPSWFQMSNPINTGTQETFTVVVNPTGLGVGTYSNTITFQSSGPTPGTTTILITLAVGTSGSTGPGNTTSVVVPTSLNFAEQSGSTYWTGGGAAQNITITGAPGGSWSASATYGTNGQNWLRLPFGQTNVQGTFPDSGVSSLLVDIQPSNIAPSSTPYTATINVSTPSGTVPVSISLLVTAANVPVMVASPASTTFTSNGGAFPPSQTVNAGGTDIGFPPAAGSSPVISASTSTTWLAVTFSGNQLTLTANPSGLATGAYQGSVTITSSNYVNSPFTYPVVLIVTGGTISTGPLTLGNSSLTFNAVPGGSLPASQFLSVSASVPTNVNVVASEQSCTGTTWLSIAPSGAFTASGTAQNITVSVNQTGISAGTTCSGTISFNSSVQQTVSVTMLVSASNSGNVTATPTSLSFQFTQGQTNPLPQTLHIVNSASGSANTAFNVAVTIQSGPTVWLSTNVSAATTPYDLSASVNPAGLSAGSTYSATITISPSGGQPVTVPVTLQVVNTATVTVSPSTPISFSYIVGGATPTAVMLQVAAGGAVAQFTATASSSGWLSVSPGSGSTPNTGTFPVTVSVNPTGLNAGTTYNGSITVNGTNGALGSTIINVTLAVTAPLPTITKITNAASYNQGAISPGEIISIFANASTPIGPATAVSLTQSLIVNNQLPTSMGTPPVQVVFLPAGYLAPLIYVSATQINCVVPYEIAGQSSVQVEVKFAGQSSQALPIQVAPAAPGIFSGNATGTGPAAYNSYDSAGTYLGQNVPVPRGGVVVFYVTGEGSTNAGNVTGRVTPSTLPFTLPLLVPSVLIDGQPANIGYAEAPGFVAGLLQINATVPTSVNTGPVSLTVSFGNTQYVSQTGIQITTK